MTDQLSQQDQNEEYFRSLMKKLEERIESKLEAQSAANALELAEVKEQMVVLSERFDDISYKFTGAKLKSDKIDEFSVFVNKAGDQLMGHEYRIANATKDLADYKYKFDKLFVDNLTVPGFIGDYCQYKTLREYLEVNIKDLSSLNSFKQQSQMDLKQYKEKLEGLIKEWSKQTNIFSSHQAENLRLLKEELLEHIDNCRKDFYSKCDDLNMNNSKYAVNLKAKSESIAFEWDKMLNYKEDINEKFTETVDAMKEDNKNTIELISGYKREFKKMQDKLVDLLEFIKDVRFRRNLVAYDAIKKSDVAQLDKRMNRGKSPEDYSYSNEMDLKFQMFDLKDFSLGVDETKVIIEEQKKKAELPKIKPNKATDYKRKGTNQNAGVTEGERKKAKRFTSSDNVPKVSFQRSTTFKRNPLGQSQGTMNAKPCEGKTVTLQLFEKIPLGDDDYPEEYDKTPKPTNNSSYVRVGKRFPTVKENAISIGKLLSPSSQTLKLKSGFQAKDTKDAKGKESIDCSPIVTQQGSKTTTTRILLSMGNNTPKESNENSQDSGLDTIKETK